MINEHNTEQNRETKAEVENDETKCSFQINQSHHHFYELYENGQSL